MLGFIHGFGIHVINIFRENKGFVFYSLKSFAVNTHMLTLMFSGTYLGNSLMQCHKL